MPAILAFGLNLDLLSLKDRPNLDEGRSAKLPIREYVLIAASAPANTVPVQFWRLVRSCRYFVWAVRFCESDSARCAAGATAA